VNRLGLDYNTSMMLAVDLMHEFELGVWKMLFTHLIRLLYACPNGAAQVELLNERYVCLSLWDTSINHLSNMKDSGKSQHSEMQLYDVFPLMCPK
jgi:hypothetical protein